MLVILTKPHSYSEKIQGKHSYSIFNKYTGFYFQTAIKMNQNISLGHKHFFSLIDKMTKSIL